MVSKPIAWTCDATDSEPLMLSSLVGGHLTKSTLDTLTRLVY